jgi:hypothetical protein
MMLHFQAWEKGIKSLYYLRSKSVQRAGFAGGVEADNTAAALANTYVRVGVLNEEGCKLVKKSGLSGTFDAGSRDNFTEGFSANGLKRFAPVKYGADFREAATESRQILDQVLQKK